MFLALFIFKLINIAWLCLDLLFILIQNLLYTYINTFFKTLHATLQYTGFACPEQIFLPLITASMSFLGKLSKSLFVLFKKQSFMEGYYAYKKFTSNEQITIQFHELNPNMEPEPKIGNKTLQALYRHYLSLSCKHHSDFWTMEQFCLFF